MILRRRIPAAISGVILALGLAGLLLAPSLDRGLRARLGAAVDGLQARVEGDFGLRFSFASLSPSIFRSLSLNRLELRDRG
ncbi:MAG: hypothetical protein JNG85_04760, partial [Spirochaetaceae bacterium]|nr:hypothetical protein [Spirochaetaceae bacterium]